MQKKYNNFLRRQSWLSSIIVFFVFTLISVYLFFVQFFVCGQLCSTDSWEFFLSKEFLLDLLMILFSPLLAIITILNQVNLIDIIGDVISGTELGYAIMVVIILFQILYGFFLVKNLKGQLIILIFSIGLSISIFLFFIQPDLGGSYLGFLPHQPKTYNVALGEEFKLMKGDTVTVEDHGIYLKLIDIIDYGKCPTFPEIGISCGVSRHYELGVGDRVYITNYLESPYTIHWGKTDRKTYVKGAIENPFEYCMKVYNDEDGCNLRLAERFKDNKYCDEVNDMYSKNNCYESLAYVLRDFSLCDKVEEPTAFCKYLQVISTLDEISDCNILNNQWDSVCYIYYSELGLFEYSGDFYVDNLCNQSGDKKTSCISAFQGYVRGDIDEDGYPSDMYVFFN